MDLPSYFADFLREIRLADGQVEECKKAHRTLRQQLKDDNGLSAALVTTFLQGSYRRATAVRPYGDKRADVDVVVVTRLSEEEYSPDQALEVFVPFLDRHYRGQYQPQGRSFGIQRSYIDLDLVVTSAPSEADLAILVSEPDSIVADDTPEDVNDWRLVESWVSSAKRSAWNAGALLKAAQKQREWALSPLRIPDREVKRWESTHPIAQIQWTHNKNQRCNGHYVNVVKAIKWWRHVNHGTHDYPKGYPVEHIVGLCCPDGIVSVAQGVVLALEGIVHSYRAEAMSKETPFLADHGVPQHNVFQRVPGEDFAAFYWQVHDAAQIARTAYDGDDLQEKVRNWQALFGREFPDPPPRDGGYTRREERSQIRGERFA